MDEVTLLGAGGHAWVVAEAARAAGLKVRAVYDDDPQAASPGDDGAVAGPLEAFFARPAPWILAMGDLELRRRLLRRLGEVAPGRQGAGADPAPAVPVIHPAAWMSPSAEVGAGVFVSARAVINARARVGAHAIVNTGAIIEHDCRVGEGAHVAPGAVLGGGVTIGADALVGLGARVLPGVSIGGRAAIGAGAVVVRDVAEGQAVRGVPAG